MNETFDNLSIVYLQVIKFDVCYFNFECGRTYLEYHDGKISNTPYGYCGLRNLVLPWSTTNTVVMDVVETTIEYNTNGLVIFVMAVVEELVDEGKRGNQTVARIIETDTDYRSEFKGKHGFFVKKKLSSNFTS